MKVLIRSLALLIAVVVAIAMVGVLRSKSEERQCQERGGEYLRTVIGWECVVLPG